MKKIISVGLLVVIILTGCIRAQETRNTDEQNEYKNKIEAQQVDQYIFNCNMQVDNILNEVDLFEGVGIDFEKDYIDKIPGSLFGYKFDAEKAVKSEIEFKFQEPRDISNTSAIGMWIYLDDANKYDSIELHIDDNNSSYKWIRSEKNLVYPLKRPWTSML